MTTRGAGVIVVTAASSNHAGALWQMLASLRRLDARVECYDIGMTADEVARLPRWDGVAHRRFEYEAYPPFMHASINAGEYAWKPVIVADVVERARAADPPCDVLWADAGCYFQALQPMAERLARTNGLWVRRSAGTMREWTHPGMFAHLHADPGEFGGKPNADATLVGFATGSGEPAAREAVYRDVVLPWKACAIEKDCIAPPGSSRSNHRQDQAVLSYLVHKAGYPFAHDTANELLVRTKCDRWFYHYIGFGVPPGLYARTCLA